MAAPFRGFLTGDSVLSPNGSIAERFAACNRCLTSKKKDSRKSLIWVALVPV